MANKKKTPKELAPDQVADEDVTSMAGPENSPKSCLIIPYPAVSEAIHFYASDDVSRIEGLMVDDQAGYYVFDRDGRRVVLNDGDWLIRLDDKPYVRPSYDVVSADDFDDLFLKIPFIAKIDRTVVKANIDSRWFDGTLLEMLREGIIEAIAVSTVRQSGDEGCRSAMTIRAVRSLTSEEV